MKKIFAVALFCSVLIAPGAVWSYGNDVRVRGYTRGDGVYVQPHYRTAPDSTRNNNYSTYGNRNPYTGKRGYKPRDGGASGWIHGGNGLGGARRVPGW